MTLLIDKAKCIGCGACVTECPIEAIDLIDGLAVVDPKKCDNLGKCVSVCPTDALSLPNQAIHPSEPNETRSTESGSKYNIQDPLPESVSDYTAGNEKKIIRTNVKPVAGGDIWSGVWV